MSVILCPSCQSKIPICQETEINWNVYFYNSNFNGKNCNPPQDLIIHITKCPECGQQIIRAKGYRGLFSKLDKLIYPASDCIKFPNYVPLQIRQDYEEACAIVNDSPKAAATLARRCLQGMIRDFWGIKCNRLVDEINALKDKIPAAQWQAVDALRKLGNIGAHMENDVNLIVEIDEGEAEQLISFVELLIKQWYVDREAANSLYSRIDEMSRQKQQHRKDHK